MCFQTWYSEEQARAGISGGTGCTEDADCDTNAGEVCDVRITDLAGPRTCGPGGGWSSIYAFSTTGEIGITRTAKLRRPNSGGVVETYGVVAIDFEMKLLSEILETTVAGTNTWAYVVEVGAGNEGKMLGSSFNAELRDGDRCTAQGNCRQYYTIVSDTIRASATHLADWGWRATAAGEVMTNTHPGENSRVGNKYEAVSTAFTLGGLEWLIVVGQDIQCAANERFVFGKCEDCPEGQVPFDDRTCLICGEVSAGTVSDEGIDGGIGTKCVCPEGKYSVRVDNALVCKKCSDLVAICI